MTFFRVLSIVCTLLAAMGGPLVTAESAAPDRYTFTLETSQDAASRSVFTLAIRVEVGRRPPVPTGFTVRTEPPSSGGTELVVVAWDAPSWDVPLDTIIRRERMIGPDQWGETTERTVPAVPALYTETPTVRGSYRYQIAFIERK